MAKAYTSASIRTLNIIEAIRNAVGMYIGSADDDGILVCIREIIDNSIDEFMNGYGKTISIHIDTKTGVITVEDQARGIPVTPYPENPKISTLEATLTLAHTGAKFGQEYGISGGLHGTGMKAVNALSSHLRATVWRDGNENVLVFNASKAVGAIQSTPLKKKDIKRTGTRIEFRLDPQYFPDAKSMIPNQEKLRTMLRERSYLNPGVHFHFSWDDRFEGFKEDDGIAAYVAKMAGDNQLFKKVAYFENEKDADIRVDVALTWTSGHSRDNVFGFCNCIRQTEGGTHVQGIRMATPGIIRKYIEDGNLLSAKDKDLKIEGPDCFEGMYAIVSIKHKSPIYKGQSKSGLSNGDAQGAVQRTVNASLSQWLEENPREAKLIAQKAISSAKARIAASKARENVRKADAGTLAMSSQSKLKDCISDDPTECELFIVEGKRVALVKSL